MVMVTVAVEADQRVFSALLSKLPSYYPVSSTAQMLFIKPTEHK
jgi:hypothetical protein